MVSKNTFKIVMFTQDYEYEGRIKACGGSDYIDAAITTEEAAKGQAYLETTYVFPAAERLAAVRGGNVIEKGYVEEYRDWALLEIDALTPYEQDQMKYDGRIDYPALHINIALTEWVTTP
uniref:hypothetical protein n=1 Tax=Escherichia coli TaxID=562 RepID=UPI0013B3A299